MCVVIVKLALSLISKTRSPYRSKPHRLLLVLPGALFVCLFRAASGDDTDIVRGARLVGGPSRLEGVVELYENGRWSLVCDDWFDEMDGVVICRMIGAAEGLPIIYTSFANGKLRRYSLSDIPFGFNKLGCSGNEDHISECRRDLGQPRCLKPEQVGLRCHAFGEARWTPPPRPTQSGRPAFTNPTSAQQTTRRSLLQLTNPDGVRPPTRKPTASSQTKPKPTTTSTTTPTTKTTTTTTAMSKMFFPTFTTAVTTEQRTEIVRELITERTTETPSSNIAGNDHIGWLIGWIVSAIILSTLAMFSIWLFMFIRRKSKRRISAQERGEDSEMSDPPW